MPDETKPEEVVTPPVETVTPQTESVDDPNVRIAAFMKEYGDLVAKFSVDFVQYPQWIPAGQGNEWKTILQIKAIDTKSLPTKSPFVVQ